MCQFAPLALLETAPNAPLAREARVYAQHGQRIAEQSVLVHVGIADPGSRFSGGACLIARLRMQHVGNSILDLIEAICKDNSQVAHFQGRPGNAGYHLWAGACAYDIAGHRHSDAL